MTSEENDDYYQKYLKYKNKMQLHIIIYFNIIYNVKNIL